MNKFQNIYDKVIKFGNDRKWENNPEDVAKSVVIEAAELLEHFQWDASGTRTKEEKLKSKNKQEISNEIADIFWYLFSLCNKLQIDPLEALEHKYEHNDKKYPVDKILSDKGGKFYMSQKIKYREGK